MRGKYLLALSVTLAVLLAPSLAFADDGFMGGLQDLVGTREVEQQKAPEEVYQDEYEPEYMPLRSGDEVQLEEGNEIQTVVDAFNTVPWTGSSGSANLLGSLRRFFFLNNGLRDVIGIPVTLVFLWWGVRKTIRILMSAFRSGRLSLGGREWNRNSYYYGTKPSDWR